MLGSIDPVFVLAGFLVGVLVGQTGVGGGSLMTPLLVLGFGVNPMSAVGTDLLFAAATKSAGTLAHGLNRTVDWRLVGWMATGSVPAGAAALVLLARMPPDDSLGAFIRTVLGGALLLTSVVMLVRRPMLHWLALHRKASLSPGATAALTVALGAVLGLLVTLSSVGAGALGIPALLLIYPHQRSAVLVGSDIAHAVPLTLLAGVGHWWLGSADLHLLASMLTGSVPGVVLGSHFAARLPEALTRTVLATLLVIAGARLLF